MNYEALSVIEDPLDLEYNVLNAELIAMGCAE